MNRPLQFIAPALAVFALAAALFAVPADEAGAHPKSSAKFHAETNPLHEAAKAGDLDSVNHFLDAHAVAVDAKDGVGETPLHKAATGGRLSVVARLIAAGANVTVKSLYGDAPLHWAVYGGVAIVATLIAEGADVDVRDGNGWTPLHHAAYGGYAAAVSALIAEGADVDVRENNRRRNAALPGRREGPSHHCRGADCGGGGCERQRRRRRHAAGQGRGRGPFLRCLGPDCGGMGIGGRPARSRPLSIRRGLPSPACANPPMWERRTIAPAPPDRWSLPMKPAASAPPNIESSPMEPAAPAPSDNWSRTGLAPRRRLRRKNARRRNGTIILQRAFASLISQLAAASIARSFAGLTTP